MSAGMYATREVPRCDSTRPGMSVFGFRIHAVSGGYVGNAGTNVSGTRAPASTLIGESAPPNASRSVSSNPLSTGWRVPAMTGSLPARGRRRARATRERAANRYDRSDSAQTRQSDPTRHRVLPQHVSRPPRRPVTREEIGQREIGASIAPFVVEAGRTCRQQRSPPSTNRLMPATCASDNAPTLGRISSFRRPACRSRSSA